MLIDTNVLVYAFDPRDSGKHQRAFDILDRLQLDGVGRLSVQCLGEFFCATTRGVHPILTQAEAAEQVEWLGRAFRVFDISPAVVREAVRGVCAHRMAYWDAQIWATARLNQIPVVLSEDFTASTIEGVRLYQSLCAGRAI